MIVSLRLLLFYFFHCHRISERILSSETKSLIGYRNLEQHTFRMIYPTRLLAILFVVLVFGVDQQNLTFSKDWKQGQAGYQFSFPRDHASHPEYKIEWWYYTGNLVTQKFRHFGYQLTFFRVGVKKRPQNPSRWAVRDLYLTHLAISDLEKENFHFSEKLNRSGPGWAGASSKSYRIWNGQWKAQLNKSGEHELRARNKDFGIKLNLNPIKSPTLHGLLGVSQKGAQPGNSSHYYSLTRLLTKGSIWIGNEHFEVSGMSWMDHEFGTTFLESKQIGWDWFGIQLNDGTDVMLFQLRRSDGQSDRHSGGTFTAASGLTKKLNASDFILKPLKMWRSPYSHAVYPIEWSLEIPTLFLKLKIRAFMLDQELRTPKSTGVTYWEGPVEILVSRRRHPIQGKGYLEMTGYAGKPMSNFLR